LAKQFQNLFPPLVRGHWKGTSTFGEILFPKEIGKVPINKLHDILFTWRQTNSMGMKKNKIFFDFDFLHFFFRTLKTSLIKKCMSYSLYDV
jgi:hypothetical protein